MKKLRRELKNSRLLQKEHYKTMQLQNNQVSTICNHIMEYKPLNTYSLNIKCNNPYLSKEIHNLNSFSIHLKKKMTFFPTAMEIQQWQQPPLTYKINKMNFLHQGMRDKLKVVHITNLMILIFMMVLI